MNFDAEPILSYLSLPDDYQPSPSATPVIFLTKHLRQLPPHLLVLFSSITMPKQRTVIPTIRNRRLKYVLSQPPDLDFSSARNKWPLLWQGMERRGEEQGKDEKEWVQRAFIGGGKQHIGNLGALLGEYEEEREAERVRELRRHAAEVEFIPEEDDSDDSDGGVPATDEQGSSEDVRTEFERRIREGFIYGMLESIDYDAVDWDDKWDEQNNRDEEDRWFNEDSDEEPVARSFST